MRVCVIAGGVGAARLLVGLVRVVDPEGVTAVVNVGDDTVVGGLHVSPDLDTVTYTLAGVIDPGRGWGLTDETWTAVETLRWYGAAAGRPDVGWFSVGDRDIGTHLYRTTRLTEGAPLSVVTDEIRRAWGIDCRVVPVTDDPLATRLLTEVGDLAFQEYFVRERHSVRVSSVRFEGAASAAPAPGVIDAIEEADVVVIAPSNPIVSIDPVLSVPGVRGALASRRPSCVAVSPLVGGRALKGPADRLMVELGHASSVSGVARLYRDLASVLVVDEVDGPHADEVVAEGLRCVTAPAIMTDPEAAARLAAVCVAAAG